MLFHCRTQKTLRLINIAYDGIWPDSLCSLGNFDCHSSRDIEKFIHDLSRNWYHCYIVQSKCSQKLSFFAVCIFWKQALAPDKLINRYSEETLSPLCLGTSAESSNNTISMGPNIDVNWKILWKQISFFHKYFERLFLGNTRWQCECRNLSRLLTIVDTKDFHSKLHLEQAHQIQEYPKYWPRTTLIVIKHYACCDQWKL